MLEKYGINWRIWLVLEYRWFHLFYAQKVSSLLLFMVGASNKTQLCKNWGKIEKCLKRDNNNENSKNCIYLEITLGMTSNKNGKLCVLFYCVILRAICGSFFHFYCTFSFSIVLFFFFILQWNSTKIPIICWKILLCDSQKGSIYICT